MLISMTEMPQSALQSSATTDLGERKNELNLSGVGERFYHILANG